MIGRIAAIMMAAAGWIMLLTSVALIILLIILPFGMFGLLFFFPSAGSRGQVVMLAFPFALLATGALLVHFAGRITRPGRRAGRCPHCGYDLRGVPGAGVCSECGANLAT